MAKVDNKTVKEKCNVMNDAWAEGSASVHFNGITQSEFLADIEAAAANDSAIADLEAEIKLKRELRNDQYVALDQKRTKIGQGVVGNPDYGDNSPLYGAMGFIRKSDRATGLRRKKKMKEEE